MSRERNPGFVDTELRDFKERLGEPNLYTFREGSARVFHIKPIEGVRPGTLPVTLIQGWGVMDPRYRKMKTVVDAGYELVAVHMDTSSGKGKIHDGRGYGLEDMRKAWVLRQVFEQEEVKKTHSITVSGGAAPALLAARMQPDLFGDMVLVTPPGLNGQVDPKVLTARFLQKGTNTSDLHLRDTLIDPSYGSATMEFLSHFFKDVPRAVREIDSVSKTDTYVLSHQVAKLGVAISVILARQDNIFPLAEIYAHFRKFKDEAGSVLSHPFKNFRIVEGNHDEQSPIHPVRVEMALADLPLVA